VPLGAGVLLERGRRSAALLVILALKFPGNYLSWQTIWSPIHLNALYRHTEQAVKRTVLAYSLSTVGLLDKSINNSHHPTLILPAETHCRACMTFSAQPIDLLALSERLQARR